MKDKPYRPSPKISVSKLFWFHFVFAFSSTIIVLHLLHAQLSPLGTSNPPAQSLTDETNLSPAGLKEPVVYPPVKKDKPPGSAAFTSKSVTEGKRPNARSVQNKAASSSIHTAKHLFLRVKASASVIRFEPRRSSPELLHTEAGDWFPVVTQQKGWIKVRLNAKQFGWIAAGSAETVQLEEKSQSLSVPAGATLYSGPDLTFSCTKALEASLYVPEQVSGQWIKLYNRDGRSLWVQAEDVHWRYGKPSQQVGSRERAGGEIRLVSTAAVKPLTGKTIVVDAGHGGKDSGAKGKKIEVYESKVNLAAAVALKNKLKAAGANVIMTRTSNDESISLAKRVDISNRNRADLFVSIHQNMFANDPDISGTRTFYSDPADKRLAETIEHSILKSLQSEEKANVKKDPLYVLRNNLRPAVLIEGCFLSNPAELTASLTTAYHDKLASGIYEGIKAYYQKQTRNTL
ncbi:N-acetylmuramoyl-L-alanine amidase [Paenibacillus beijingensis]|uniref:N-acetylmuramoyl-L-alanine amidase n=1 Tax=Paenibacillus beijingensis TaxID=1126833 RepID=UPI000697F4A6|nr:N-acetylmuramoyl-L-alanine amidase [Paenibacillus beijingensis]